MPELIHVREAVAIVERLCAGEEPGSVMGDHPNCGRFAVDAWHAVAGLLLRLEIAETALRNITGVDEARDLESREVTQRVIEWIAETSRREDEDA